MVRRSDLAAFLVRLRTAADADLVVVSVAPADQAAEELGWGKAEILGELRELQPEDLLRTELSTARGGDLVWVFCPPYEGGRELWTRLVERDDGVVVVSFHLREWL